MTITSVIPSSTSTSATVSLSLKKALSIRGIVGITIRSLEVFILVGLLIYIYRRQKKPEVLRSSQIPSQAEHSSNVALNPRISVSQYTESGLRKQRYRRSRGKGAV